MWIGIRRRRWQNYLKAYSGKKSRFMFALCILAVEYMLSGASRRYA